MHQHITTEPTERQRRQDGEAIHTLRRKYGGRALEKAKRERERGYADPDRMERLDRIIPRMEREETS